MSETVVKRKSKLQQITEAAWLVYADNNRLGILSRDAQQQYTFINGTSWLKFDDKNEVIEHFGNTHLFKEQITTDITIPDAIYIKGFKVESPSPVCISEDDPMYNPNLPLYMKKQNSTVAFAAGHYCLQFPNLGWTLAHCPKAATLGTYEYRGPFKTKELAAVERRRLRSASQ